MTVNGHWRPGIADGNTFGSNPEAQALREALDRMWEAVAIVTATGQVVYANAAAARILRRGAGLLMKADGRVVTGCDFARLKLVVALKEQIAIAFAAPRRGQPPLLLRIEPLSAGLRETLGAAAFLFISDPDEKLSDCTAALRSAYGLTGREAQLVQSLSEGASLKKIAHNHRVTYETVRTYVRRILSKTGVRRQAELVRITHALR